MSEDEMREEIQKLRGEVAALTLVSTLLINQFARTPALRQSFVDLLRAAPEDMPDGPNVQARDGLRKLFAKIADGIVTDEIV